MPDRRELTGGSSVWVGEKHKEEGEKKEKERERRIDRRPPTVTAGTTIDGYRDSSVRVSSS
ncbi:hypothetical protein [Halomontanus rarus]|uniref:hypothetical protein n=1 Tax=Halomontanus rarus TaxID=3034020 RepID=UPI0023E7797E|nr:hypothetical protein [Halovivax sp. TS33]